MGEGDWNRKAFDSGRTEERMRAQILFSCEVEQGRRAKIEAGRSGVRHKEELPEHAIPPLIFKGNVI